jgi:hypothetical protein
MLHKSLLRSSLFAVVAGTLALAPVASAAPLTPGNLVVLRVSGSAATNAAAATLLEYTTGGDLVQSLIVPSADAATALTFRGSSSTEGSLSISGDGNYITFAGHRVAAGSTNPNNVNTAGARGVGRVSVGDFTTSGLITTTLPGVLYSSDSVRSAVTNDGNQYWISGAGNSATNGGLQYFDGSIVTALNGASNNNTRQVQILDSTLYMSSGSGTPGRGIYKSSPALPTSGTPTLTRFTPVEAAKQYQNFVMADLSPNFGYDSTAYDTAYATDSNAGALVKFTFDGTNWTLSATTIALSGSVGLTGLNGPNGFQLYATQSTTNTGALQQFLDGSGYGGTLTGSFAGLTTPVTAGTDNGLRGIVMVPVPEPATVTMMAGLAVVGLVVGLRRRRS